VLIGGSLTLFFSCWHFAWTAIEDEVRQSETFGFSAERLSVTPKPSWIHEDITREALNSASLDGSVSLMDGDLTERISGAFTLQPWVDRVISVRKHYPGRVEVELEYLGRPIAMVEIPGNLCPGNLEGGLYPIDAAGNLLPTGYFIREARTEASTEYLRLRGIRSLPDGPEGSSWGDPRVRQAGGIAAALEPHRRNLQLTHLLVEPAASGEADPDLTRNRFTLLTRQGNRVVWGTLKENEEIAPEEARKQVDRLLALARKHGSLDGIPDHSVTFASPR
jgi:hypothetical protein